jgi:hypothetical protein
MEASDAGIGNHLAGTGGLDGAGKRRVAAK